MAFSFSAPWPDQNSPVLSKINFGVPLPELFKWLEVRDTLLGHNFKTQDITKAVALAQDCKHPDAVWLSSVCKDVSSIDQAREVFLSHQDDARALCFAWWLTDKHDREADWSLIRRSSQMGFPLACCALCERVWDDDGNERVRLAQFAAEQQERDGIFLFACCLQMRVCLNLNDLKRARDNHLIAAELGYVFAARNLSVLMDGESEDLARWIWSGRAASHGWTMTFIPNFPTPVLEFASGSGNASVVFVIGRVLKGKVDKKNREILGQYLLTFDSYSGPATKAVSFYEWQIESARLAVDAWVLVGKRLGIIKDIRRLIGQLIWEARLEANYKGWKVESLGAKELI